MATGAPADASDAPGAGAPTARRRVWAACQVALGLGLLAWLLHDVEFVELGALVRRGHAGLLAAGFACLFAALPVLQALRLHVLVVPYTGRLASSFEVFFVGAFFNNLLPSNLGGDAVRLVYLRRMATTNWGGPLAMLLLHRASSFAVLLLGALVSFPLRRHALLAAFAGESRLPGWLVPAALVALTGGCVVALVVLAAPALRARLFALVGRVGRESLAALRQTSRRSLGALAVLTVLFHGSRVVGVGLLLVALGTPAHPLDVLIALAVSGFAVVLPLSVGGLGVMEGALSMTLVAFGASHTEAIAVALANRTVLLGNALAGGIVYLASRRERATRQR